MHARQTDFAELQKGQQGSRKVYLEQHHLAFHSSPAGHAHGLDFLLKSLQRNSSYNSCLQLNLK